MNRHTNPKQLANGGSGFTRRRLMWAVVASLVVAIATVSLIASSLLTNSGTESTASYELAPDIAVATAAGNFQLSDHRGKVVVLYFSFPG